MWKAGFAAVVVVLLLSANRRAKPRPRRNLSAKKARRRARLGRLLAEMDEDAKPAKPTPKPRPQPEPTDDPPMPPAAYVPEHGLVIVDGELAVADWTNWMAFATAQARRAVAEGAHRPEHVIARIFYAAFPDLRWPPEADSPLCDTYDRLVEVAADNLDDELRPLRVADHHGLVLVD